MSGSSKWFFVDQGILIGKYEFFENKSETYTGVFNGLVKTKWYLDKKDKVRYLMCRKNIEKKGWLDIALKNKIQNQNIENEKSVRIKEWWL